MKYLILGANAAGMSAAVRIVKFDKTAQVTVLEKSDVVSFGSCGIPYYVAGEFSDIEQMTARPVEAFINSGIDLRLFHTATGLDSQNKQVIVFDNTCQQELRIDYDRLLIAVGASASRPAIKGLESGNVFTMHSKQDAAAIVAALPGVINVTIIGAGFIGIEAAEAFREQGKNVTLIEFAPRILERAFDAEISELLAAELRNKGVNLRTSEGVSEIVANNGKVTKVITNTAEYAADLVIMAVGFRPNTDFLRQSGLHFDSQGAIVIDDQCRTNIRDVFAAGDCASVKHLISGNRYIPLATTANKLGRLAGDVMAGQNKRFIGTLGSSGIRIFSLEAGRTGITQAEADTLKLNIGTVFIKDKNHTGYVKTQTDMWVKLIYDQQTRKLLGGQICGSYHGGAVHRVDALAVAVYSGLTVDELGFMDFIYAPPFARTWDILNVAGNVAK